MNETMKAVVIRGYGSNERVEIIDTACPVPQPGEVLVRVRTAGVNPIDWKIRSGAGERLGMRLTIHLGGELVGTVERLGEGVEEFQPGEAVYGMVHSGAFADYALAKAIHLARPPANLDWVGAAALPLAGTTAWQALFGKAELTAGQRLLITNASGGVGSLAVQFAKARGAHVTGMASGRNKEFVRRLGADDFIDYTRQPFEQVAKDMDVVFDTVGGDTFARAFQTLRKGGFLVTVVAFPQNEAARYGVRVERSFTQPDASTLVAIRELVEAGRVEPHVATVLPLAEVRQALDLSEQGHSRGKIVLEMASGK